MKEYLDAIKKIALKHSINLLLKPLNGVDGQFYKPNTLVVNSNIKTPARLLSVFFHELGHADFWKNNKFRVYHGRCDPSLNTYKNNISVAVKAEMAVDDWAEKQMAQYYPKIKFIRSYVGWKWSHHWLTNYYKQCFRNNLS